MATFLKHIDTLADDEAPNHKLSIDGNTEYKSALGGFCTLTVLLKEGIEVINISNPFVQSRAVQDDMQYKTPFS